MNCHYRVHEEWVKGTLLSLSGCTQACFTSRDAEERIREEIVLNNPHFHFYGGGFTVTGYQRTGDNSFRLVSVDVRIHHSQCH